MPWTEASKRKMVATRRRNAKANAKAQRAKGSKMATLPSVIEQVQQQRAAAAASNAPQSIDKLAQLIIAVARNL